MPAQIRARMRAGTCGDAGGVGGRAWWSKMNDIVHPFRPEMCSG